MLSKLACAALLQFSLLGASVQLTDLTASPQMYENQTVTIRGFLYRDEQGHLLLADQPHLKSCCIHKTAHLKIEAEEPAHLNPSVVAEVTGTLTRKENFFVLSDSRVSSQAANLSLVYVAMGVTLLIAAIVLILKKR